LEALATATGKAAYDWIKCLEKYGTGFNISLHVQLRFLLWSICQYDSFCSLLRLQAIWLHA